jgi:hypothetical protein
VPNVARVDLGVSRGNNVSAVKSKKFGPANRTVVNTEDAILEDLWCFPEVEVICSRTMPIDIKATKCLSRLPNLKELWVDECGISDSGVKEILKNKSLLALSIYGSDCVSDLVIDALCDNKNLIALSIRGTRITPAGVQRLRLHKPGCNVVGSGGRLASGFNGFRL